MAATVTYDRTSFPGTVNLSDVVSNVFKIWYKDGAPPDLTMQDHPSYGLLPKTLWTGGLPYTYGVKIANMAGRSKTFTSAKTNDAPSRLAKFGLTRVKDYARTTLDNETMMSLKNDAQGFFDYLREQIDGGFTEIGDVLAHEMFRDGTSKVARIASASVSTNTTWTLTDKAEIKAFGLNDVLEFCDDSAFLVYRPVLSSSVGRVIAIDHDAGTVTTAGDYADYKEGGDGDTWTTDGESLEAGVDCLAFDGDMSGSGSAFAQTAIAGLEGWNPETAPSSGESWFGLDRSVAPNYLAGGREDFSTGVGMREALMTWCSKAHRYRGKWQVIVINPENFTELEKELTSISYINLTITSPNEAQQIGYRAIELAVPWGTVPVVADPDCPLNLARGVTFSELKFMTVGQVGPYVINDDGNMLHRLEGEDSFELRIGYYGNIANHNPKMFSRCKLPAVNA